MAYCIRKSSRWSVHPHPYQGYSCERTGVEPGKIYDTREEAQADADKLTAFNPVGFEVIDMACHCPACGEKLP